MRDKTELLLLKEALSADKPILGICRGIQFINAALGGTLYQDIPSEVNSQTTHCQKPPYNIPIHKVKLIKGTPLYALLQKESLNVNSYHHQAVKKIAPSACKAAEAEDGITEALYVPGKKFVWAVQWHPEFSFHTDSDSLKIFEEFVSKCIP